MREQRRLERPLQVLRQSGADSAPHAPDGRACPDAWDAKASQRRTTFPRNTISRATISPTPSWAWSPARRGPTCTAAWSAGTKGDNGILYHSKAYKLQPGTGWQIDAGVLHAPGSLVTYEPQVNSDVFGMFQSMVEGRAVPWDLLVKDVPPEHAPRPGLHRRACWTGKPT